jgi:lysine-specific demethylase 8
MSHEILDRIKTYHDNPLTEIETISKITHDSFQTNYLKKNKPIALTGMMNNWEATKKWSLDYFKKIGKNKESYVAKANNFQEETKWDHENFVKSIENIENTNSVDKGGYLMNLSIMHMFPELMNDVDFSLVSKNKVRQSTSLWIGPKGTVTPWHTDRLADNILSVIKGHKLVLLADPSQNKHMHISKKYEPGSLISLVDLENFEENKFSLYKKYAKIQYTILEPGKMVFIPKQWWHCVYGLDLCISSNSFCFSFIDNLKMKASEFPKRILHKYGLYGKECVCHYLDENGKRQRYRHLSA